MTNREQMIQELRERLQWLESNSSEEETGKEEAEAIEQLLQVMEQSSEAEKQSPEEKELNLEEGYYSVEEAMGRFWETYDARAEIAAERERLLNGKAAKKKRQNIFLYFAGHRGVAAAAVIGLLALGLFAGAVGSYAVQGMEGNFFLFKRDEEGTQGMVTPGEGFGNNVDFEERNVYYNVEDLPEEYGQFFTLPMSLDVGYRSEEIKFWDMSKYICYRVIYCDERGKDKFVDCYQQYYKEGLIYFNDDYDMYATGERKTVGEVEVNYYNKRGEDGEKSIAAFQIGKSVYTVQGYLELEEVEKVAEGIINYLQNN